MPKEQFDFSKPEDQEQFNASLEGVKEMLIDQAQNDALKKNEQPDPEIFKNGRGVCVIDGGSNAVERWVRLVAKKADAKVDWHYSGGRASVLHLGDEASRQRVLDAISELKDELKGRILSVGGPALYRAGDQVPKGTIAVDPDFGPIIDHK